MSIRLIAKELYRSRQQVEKLEAELEAAPYPEKEAIKEQLRQARAEYQQIKNIMEGEKILPLSAFKKKS